MSEMEREPQTKREDVRRDEGRRDEGRRDEREEMRTNPEVMGRTEPRDMPEGRRDGPGTPADRPARSESERSMRADERMEMWPDMRQYKARMVEIQSQFIDDPREAVKKAEKLIDEMVDYMAKSMHEQVRRWHKDVEGNADTERLRLMMREFSQIMERFEGRQAA
jgi:DNA replicative helicase MCM subunit Mcm2 (Cdc46/Mcm family)